MNALCAGIRCCGLLFSHGMKTSAAEDASSHHHDEHPDLAALNARTGLWLFAAYTAVYAAFVWLSAFSVETMAMPTPIGPNVAILYGFGLIFGAIVLALVYMALCKRNADLVRRAGDVRPPVVGSEPGNSEARR